MCQKRQSKMQNTVLAIHREPDQRVSLLLTSHEIELIATNFTCSGASDLINKISKVILTGVTELIGYHIFGGIFVLQIWYIILDKERNTYRVTK